MKRTPVKSSNIKSVGYSSTSRKLEVEFISGTVYEYGGVEPSVALTFLKSQSKGKYFSTFIKNKYKGSKL